MLLLPAQVLEHKLRLLDAFLLEAADRRRARGFRTDGSTFGGPSSAAAGAGPAAAGLSAAAASGGGGLFGGFLEDGSNRLNAAAGAAMAAGGGFGGFGSMAPAMGVGGVQGPLGQPAGAPAAKRQRLWTAALAEEQRNNAIRVLASKAAQALFLLRTLTAANVNRLVLRLAETTRKALADLVSGAWHQQLHPVGKMCPGDRPCLSCSSCCSCCLHTAW